MIEPRKNTGINSNTGSKATHRAAQKKKVITHAKKEVTGQG